MPSSFYQPLNEELEVESSPFKLPDINFEALKKSMSRKQARSNADKMDKFMNTKLTLDPQFKDLPFSERLMKSNIKRHTKSTNDFDLLDKKKRQEKKLIEEIEQLLV